MYSEYSVSTLYLGSLADRKNLIVKLDGIRRQMKVGESIGIYYRFFIRFSRFFSFIPSFFLVLAFAFYRSPNLNYPTTLVSVDTMSNEPKSYTYNYVCADVRIYAIEHNFQNKKK